MIFDSALADTSQQVSYVSTDNGKGGHLAGKRMGELLKGAGTVLMLRYQEGSAATEEREQGFLDELKAGFPGITVISSDQYAGADARHREARLGEPAQPLRRQGRRHLHAQRVVHGRDAARAAGHRQGRIDHVRRLRLQLRASSRRSSKGELKGFVVQNPVNMGYLSVKTMVEHLQGKQVPATVDTGVMLVTLDNLQRSATVQAVINPPEAAGN